MQQRLHNLILKRLQSMRRARREVAGVTFCARTFQKTRALFLLLSHRPQQKGWAGGSPTGVFVAWCNVGTFVRLCFGVSCGIARARSFVCNRGRACRGHVVPVVSVRHVVVVAVASLGVAVAVAS